MYAASQTITQAILKKAADMEDLATRQQEQAQPAETQQPASAGSAGKAPLFELSINVTRPDWP